MLINGPPSDYVFPFLEVSVTREPGMCLYSWGGSNSALSHVGKKYKIYNTNIVVEICCSPTFWSAIA